MTTVEELVDELAELLYLEVERPHRFRFDDLTDARRDCWRAGAQRAIRWLGEFPRADPDRDAATITLDEVIG